MRRVELVPDWLEGTRPTVSRVFAQRNRAEEKLNFQKTILEPMVKRPSMAYLSSLPKGT